MRFSDIDITRKIGAAFVVIVVGAAVMGAVVFGNVLGVERSNLVAQKDNAVALAAIEARFTVTRQEGSLRGYMITKDPYYAQRVKDHYERFKTAVNDIRTAAYDPAVLGRLDELETAMANWHEHVADPVIALSGSEATYPQAVDILTSGVADQYIEPVEEILDGYWDLKKKAAEASQAKQMQNAKTTEWVLGAGMLLLILLAVGLGWVLYRAIAKPIRGITETMRDLAAGNKSVIVPAVDRKDEIGAMAGAVETFKQAAIERERLEAEARATREREAAEKARQAAEEHEKAERLEAFVGDIEQGFDRLSQGDLTVRLERPVAPEYEEIRGRFNASVEKLEDTFGSVIGSIGSIRSGLDEINSATNDLAQRTEQQAAGLEETSAALTEVTRAVNETAESAGRAQNSAETAQKNAEKGGAIVGQAVEAMAEIEKSSEEISKIIGVIDEIAFQTNLLALN
ncbi:HAMP domain-containing methyl-accepting chemotaxis protein, partial [Consotaella aegiceratis]|uniref:HAMP domain-containing methyl-accepting chemotaxis protein n=1 Tax=Consotaella aegiceratis TaxID=3097961 RepID=UPI002F3E9DE8